MRSSSFMCGVGKLKQVGKLKSLWTLRKNPHISVVLQVLHFPNEENEFCSFLQCNWISWCHYLLKIYWFSGLLLLFNRHCPRRSSFNHLHSDHDDCWSRTKQSPVDTSWPSIETCCEKPETLQQIVNKQLMGFFGPFPSCLYSGHKWQFIMSDIICKVCLEGHYPLLWQERYAFVWIQMD